MKPSIRQVQRALQDLAEHGRLRVIVMDAPNVRPATLRTRLDLAPGPGPACSVLTLIVTVDVDGRLAIREAERILTDD